jgi:hypothetical protein
MTHDDSTDTPIAIVAAPPIAMTANGDMDENAAAAYLAHRMRCASITPRRLRRWRNERIGPIYRKVPGGREVWYRKPDIDEWLEICCAVDPVAA